MIAVPALDAPVFICVALPAAAAVALVAEEFAVVDPDPVEEPVDGDRMPRSRGAIKRANRSAVVVPVSRMVLIRVPFVTWVVRTCEPTFLSLASPRDTRTPAATAAPTIETVIQSFARRVITILDSKVGGRTSVSRPPGVGQP